MKLHLGSIPETPDFVPAPPWRPMREPGPWVMQLIALPIGLLSAGIILLLWFSITPLRVDRAALSPAAFVISFAGLIIVHELAHAMVHPGAGRSCDSVLGFWPSRGLFYAGFLGEMTRNRFLAILLTPLFVISIVPLALSAVAQVTSGWAAYLGSLNALMACGDVLGAGLVWFQVPSTATVRNQGWRTYWIRRTPDEPSSQDNQSKKIPSDG